MYINEKCGRQKQTQKTNQISKNKVYVLVVVVRKNCYANACHGNMIIKAFKIVTRQALSNAIYCQ